MIDSEFDVESKSGWVGWCERLWGALRWNSGSLACIWPESAWSWSECWKQRTNVITMNWTVRHGNKKISFPHRTHLTSTSRHSRSCHQPKATVSHITGLGERIIPILAQIISVNMPALVTAHHDILAETEAAESNSSPIISILDGEEVSGGRRSVKYSKWSYSFPSSVGALRVQSVPDFLSKMFTELGRICRHCRTSTRVNSTWAGQMWPNVRGCWRRWKSV